MKKIFSAWLFLIIIPLTSSTTIQEWEDTCSVRRDLNHLFSRLEKSRVPSGLLMDFSVNLIELDNYDGTALVDSNFVDFSTFSSIFRTLRSADVTGNFSMITLNDMREAMYSEMEDGKNAVGIIFHDYNTIVPNALSDSLLFYSNDGYVTDVYRNSTWVDPYETKKVIAFSPYRNIHRGGTVTYSMKCLYPFCNKIGYVFEFDPGDGSGYHTVNNDQDVVAIYPHDGEYELKFRVRHQLSMFYPQTYTAHSSIVILDVYPGPYGSNSINDVDSSFSVSCRTPSGVICPNAIVSIKRCAPGRSRLVHPFIVSEGFDPFRIDPQYSDTSFYGKGSTNLSSFLSSSIYQVARDSCDIVYIDWMNSTASIKDNADILMQVIQWANERMVDPTDRIQLLGQSMGGLIARYALCNMEQAGQRHNVETFISHDVPHLGVNVPIGLLYAVRYIFALYRSDYIIDLLIRCLGVFSSTAQTYYDDLMALLDSESVKQMLINYVNGSFQIDNTVHQSWQVELKNMGFPQGDGKTAFKTICLSNGGSQGSPVFWGTIYASASLGLLLEILLDHDEIITALTGFPNSFWLGVIPGRTTVNTSIGINSWLTNSSKVFDSKIKYKKRLLWLFDVDKVMSEISFFAPVAEYPMDRAKGSYFNLSSYIGSTSLYSGWVGGYTLSYSFNDFVFVPTVSSLCLDSGADTPSATDYEKDWSSYHSEVLTRCPFNAYYLPEFAESHISSRNSVSWLSSVLPMKLEGPGVAWSDSVFVLNNPLVTDISLSLSDNTKGYFEGSVLHALEPGKVDVYCSGELVDQPFRLKKSIIIGSLDCFLTDSLFRTESNQDKIYNVTADFVLSGMDDLFEWSEPPVLSGDHPVYHWSVETYPSNTTQEIDFALKTILVRVPYGMMTCISLTLEYNGCFSQPTSIVIHNPMQHPPFPINPDGTVFVADNNGHVIPVRGEIDDSIYDYCFEMTQVSYKGKAEMTTLLHDLLTEPVWTERLKAMKPWGTQDYLLIPYTETNRSSGESNKQLLKFFYHE